MQTQNLNKYNKKLEIFVWVFAIQFVFLFYLFVVYLYTFFYFEKIKMNSQIGNKITNNISFWFFIYESGKISWINKFLMLIDSDIYYKGSVGLIVDFFNHGIINTDQQIEENSSINDSNIKVIYSFFYWMNVFVQIGVFLFIALILSFVFNFCLFWNLLFIALKNNSQQQLNSLLNVVGFIFVGYLYSKNRESKLLKDKNYEELSKPIFKKYSGLYKWIRFFDTKLISFQKNSHNDLLKLECVSFSYETKHNVIKHWMDHYKNHKYGIHRCIDEDQHLFTFKCLFTKDKRVTLALKDINLTIKEGSFNVIIGPNGCGKSTLLKTIINLQENYTGKIYWYGESLNHIKNIDIAKNISYVPQEMNLQDGLTIYEFLSYSRLPFSGLNDSLKENDQLSILNAIKNSGCYEFNTEQIKDLSGGQRQKVLLASVLAKNTDIIVLDEPTTFFDLKNQLNFLNFLKQLQNKGKTIIVILHDLEHAINYATNLIVLKDGRLYKQGSPEEIVDKKLFQEVFNIDCEITRNNGQLSLKNIYPLCS